MTSSIKILHVEEITIKVNGSDLKDNCFLKERSGMLYVYSSYEGYEFPIPKAVARRVMDRDYNFIIEVEIRKVVDQFGHEDSIMYHVNIL